MEKSVGAFSQLSQRHQKPQSHYARHRFKRPARVLTELIAGLGPEAAVRQPTASRQIILYSGNLRHGNHDNTGDRAGAEYYLRHNETPKRRAQLLPTSL